MDDTWDCDCSLCIVLRWGYTFITNPIVIFCLGISVTWIIFYLQYHKSIAAFRLKKVIYATIETVTEVRKTNQYLGYIRNRSRFSMGVPIDSMANTFGTNNGDKVIDHYPNLSNLNSDRWDVFISYVRPVIDDINPYSFLGSIPFNKEMRQLQMLVKLCNAIEDVVAELDVVGLIQKNNNVEIMKDNQPPGFIIVDNEQFKSEIGMLKSKYNELEIVWNKWLKVIES